MRYLIFFTFLLSINWLYSQTVKPEHLTLDAFKTNIFDYEKNKDKWVYEGKVPAIIDFYADWCGPCRLIAPIMEELAAEYDGKLKIYKVNTDKEVELAAMFGIQSLPSLLFIPLEGQPQLALGAMPKQFFVENIEKVLKVAPKKQ